MAAITSITENWSGHSFKEVETHIKGSYLPLTSVSVDSISSGVANVLTLNSSNAVKKTSLSDLASLLGGGGENRTITTNTELTSLGVGLYTSPYCSYISGAPTAIPSNNAIAFIRIWYKTSSEGEPTKTTVVFDLEGAGVYVRRNDTGAAWQLCAS